MEGGGYLQYIQSSGKEGSDLNLLISHYGGGTRTSFYGKKREIKKIGSPRDLKGCAKVYSCSLLRYYIDYLLHLYAFSPLPYASPFQAPLSLKEIIPIIYPQNPLINSSIVIGFLTAFEKPSLKLTQTWLLTPPPFPFLFIPTFMSVSVSPSFFFLSPPPC